MVNPSTTIAPPPASTREALISATVELILERGWRGTSVQTIARRAGLTTGAIYCNFDGATGLLEAALLAGQQAMMPPLRPELGLRGAVRQFAVDYLELLAQPRMRRWFAAELDFVTALLDDPDRLSAFRERTSAQVQRLGDVLLELADGRVDALRHGVTGSATVLMSVLSGLAQASLLAGELVTPRMAGQAAVDAVVAAADGP